MDDFLLKAINVYLCFTYHIILYKAIVIIAYFYH